ncbi:MAG TPA: helix-turn-helix transcriptional regulator [Verrucomicrobiae bacterium]|jgi:transcriptional regulator with XRE-family HTH domain
MKAIPPCYLTPDLYPDRLNRQIGRELRARRESLNLSAYALSKDARVTDQTILNIEQGTTSPNLTTLALLCLRFGIRVAEFLASAEQRPD